MTKYKKAKCFVWVSPEDCLPPHGLDLESEHDADKVSFLKDKFQQEGFDLTKPALVGYPLNGKIQLLSGTHRHYAANLIGMKLPVTLWLGSDIEKLWGTEEWPRVLEDIPVKDLEEYSILEGFNVPEYDPVNIELFDREE